jgi:hypothetical protein
MSLRTNAKYRNTTLNGQMYVAASQILPNSDIEKVYNTTFIRWTTHSPPGLSEKDLVMAKFCDEQAALKEEVQVEEEENAGDDVGRELADRVAREGGDCCVPKKKDG